MDETFRWTSPLGLSVILFLLIGALWIFVGVLSVPLTRKWETPEYLFTSASADNSFYGAPASQLAPPGSPLAKFRTMMISIISGFLVLGGLLVISMAWFALRQGQLWALVALVLAILAATAFWTFALLPYIRAGVSLRLGDIPPLIWIPAILILPAFILGWLGLR